MNGINRKVVTLKRNLFTFSTKITAMLLSIVMLMVFELPVFADTNDLKNDSQFLMYDYIKQGQHEILLSSKYYGYISVYDNFINSQSCVILGELIDAYISSGSLIEPSKEDYVRVLVDIMALQDRNNAYDLSEQIKRDHLKSIKDYGIDLASIGANVVAVCSGTQSLGNLENNIATAIGALDVVKDNVTNWIDALTNLETILRNYQNHDLFLETIENNSGGNLKEAASLLRNGLKKAMKLKLETYTKVSSEDIDRYSEFFFEEVFFDFLKQTPEYNSDREFQELVDNRSEFVKNCGVLEASWDLGTKIGTLIGDIAVGGENLIRRMQDMKILSDIQNTLAIGMIQTVRSYLSAYKNDDLIKEKEFTNKYVELSHYFTICALRGEYSLYSIVANDAGLLTWFKKKNGDEMKEWYEKRKETIMLLQNKVDQLIENISQQENIENIENIENDQGKRPIKIADYEKANTIGNNTNNIINGAISARQGDWYFYSNSYHIDTEEGLIRENFSTGECEKIADGHFGNINVIGDYIYCISDKGLIKMKTNGEEYQTIIDHVVYNLNIIGDTMYFIDDGYIFSMREGKDPIKLSEKKAWKMLVSNGWIYYAEEVKGNPVYKMTINGEEHTKLLEEAYGAWMCIENDWLYYFKPSDYMHRINVKTAEDERIITRVSSDFNIRDGYIYSNGYESKEGERLVSKFSVDSGIDDIQTVVIADALDLNIHGDWLLYIDASTYTVQKQRITVE